MKTPADPVRRLRIPELIQQVRSELVEAASRHQKSGNEGLLYIQKVTLEINVGVSAEETAEGAAGANIWVLDFKAGGTKALRSEHVHKVTVEMMVRAPGAPLALMGTALPAASVPAKLPPMPTAAALKPAK